MPDIYFVRHGQSQANLQKVAAGASDSPLTELGIEQAHREAELIQHKSIKFDLIISSTLSRAYDTAKIIAQQVGYDLKNIITSDLLIERSLGEFEKQPLEEFYSSSEQEKEEKGCEKLSDLYLRVKDANAFITENAKGNTLVVGHSGFYRMARCVAEGLAPELTYTLEQPQNSSLLKYPL